MDPMMLHSTFINYTFYVLGKKRWKTLADAKHWKDILSLPDLSKVKPHPQIFRGGPPPLSKREQKLMWESLAKDFYYSRKQRIDKQIRLAENYLRDELSVWNRHHTEKNEQLPLDQIFRQWLDSVESLTLREFYWLNISAETARQFLEPKYKEIKNRYFLSMESESILPLLNDSTIQIGHSFPLSNLALSLRQIALLYIYQNKIISREEQANDIARNYGKNSGARLLRFYNTFRHTYNRTGVDGRQIMPLLNDIDAVIPYLNDEQKQQAKAEQKTIRAKIL